MDSVNTPRQLSTSKQKKNSWLGALSDIRPSPISFLADKNKGAECSWYLAGHQHTSSVCMFQTTCDI